MWTPWTALASLLLIAVLTTSCQKLSELGGPLGPLRVEQVAFDNAISLEYGDLVAITPHPSSVESAVLWFMKPDKTIVVVAVNGARGTIEAKALIIPRR